MTSRYIQRQEGVYMMAQQQQQQHHHHSHHHHHHHGLQQQQQQQHYRIMPPQVPPPQQRQDAFHSQTATYVTQTQGQPNQGPGLRNGPPNQSSTPPNSDLKVSAIPGQIPPMQQQYVSNTVRTGPYFQPRNAGGPPTQTPRMPNQPHRAQAPMFPSQYAVMQPVYIQQQPAPMYYNPQRPPSNLMSQPFPQMFSPSIQNFQHYGQPVNSGVAALAAYSMYPPQTGPMSIPRTTGTPVTAAPTVGTSAGTLSNTPMMPPVVPPPTSYTRPQRTRRSKAIPIIDPKTGQDKLDEIYESENTSHPTSGESSARQTPQPTQQIPNKEIQAAFAKQVAQAISEDKQQQNHASSTTLDQPAVETTQRIDVQHSSLQYDAKEFVSSIKEDTPIVSANSDAAEVILSKKERESPAKVKKQQPKNEAYNNKEATPKETECDKSSSIVKEDIVPVPTPIVNIPAESGPVNKETSKEAANKGAKKQSQAEPQSIDPAPQVHATGASSHVDVNNGKSKNSRNKNAPPPNHHQQHQSQNGKTPQQPQLPAAVAPVPAPQPPKPNNRSNKSKELNLKGANKEGTDMDAFNDNSAPKTEINANTVVATPPSESATNVPVNNNLVVSQKEQPAPQETDNALSSTIEMSGKDSNENMTSVQQPEIVTPPVALVPPPAVAKPLTKVFDVMGIVKDTPPRMVKPSFPPTGGQDEIDKTLNIENSNTTVARNELNGRNDLLKTLYKPGQWSPDNPEGKKTYHKELLIQLRSVPASLQKYPNIPDFCLADDRTRQLDGRLSMGGRTDYTNPPFNNYGGKSSSQKATVSKRGSQSKMGSRSGGGADKLSKPQPKLSISLRGDVKLHETENAWKPARFNQIDSTTEEEKKTQALYRKVRSILNKLTPQKFETLVNQIKQMQIDSKDRLQGVINLVFDKAIDEPKFSLAYAMMCKEIQNMQVVGASDVPDKSVAFKTLLVIRCQTEFEKQSVDETERNNKLKEIQECTDQEKKKELKDELEEYDRRLRMKSVGCIRFIGELFKQHMLTPSIMLRCLHVLLNNRDEESLECLCKLLTTIGKELESKNSDLSSIFDEMKRISQNRKKVSSRIRFMLQDVIDLRDAKWVPRHGDTNPKTIDQIQKEAETEQLNIQANNMNPPRRDDRPLHVFSGSRTGGGGRPKPNEDGWSPVANRNSRNSFTFQPEKMRIAKVTGEEVQLGSRHMHESWAKGVAPVVPPPSQNMYAALENYGGDTDRRTLNPRDNKGPYSSKGPSMERNSYNNSSGNKNYDGRGSRSGSQHRDSLRKATNTQPLLPSNKVAYPPAVLQPANLSSVIGQQQSTQIPPAAAPIGSSVNLGGTSKFTDEQIQRRICNSADEFVTNCCTANEYFQDIAACVPNTEYSRAVYESYNYILEKSQQARLRTGHLFAALIKNGDITEDDFVKGFKELLDCWEDLIVDVPQIWLYFAEDIVALVVEEALSLGGLKRLLEGLISSNVAKQLLKHLFTLVIKEKSAHFLQELWVKAGLQLSEFIPADDVDDFVKNNGFEFLVSADATELSYEQIQKKLIDFLKKRTPFDDVVDWITQNVGARVKENKFVRALATAIFETSISKNKLQPEVLSSHSKLIQKYVDINTDLELQCLYALQALVHKMEHPQGLLLTICDQLYENATFSQESFIAWETSSDPAEQEGKGVALKQLTSFFTRLKENEEDEEYSSSEDV